MSKAKMLRGLVNQRLTAAAQEICGLLEGTIAEYEEELCRLKGENERHRKLLDAVFNPEVRLQRTEEQEPRHIKKDREDPEPPDFKEDQEELSTNQEGEQLPGLEEAGSKLAFTPVKSKDDEEEVQSSQLYQRQNELMKTEADEADCGGTEPDRKLVPESDSGPDTHETEDSVDWEETQEPQSDVNPLQNKEVPVCDVDCSTGNASINSPDDAASFDHKGQLEKPTSSYTGEKQFQCSHCDKRFRMKKGLKRHTFIHTRDKPFSCSVCSQTFTRKVQLDSHMIVHKGDKPFECSICDKTFRFKNALKRHMYVHTGEKPFSCSVCSQMFRQKGNLNYHMTVHTREKPFRCSLCSKTFPRKGHLKIHMTVHTGP